MTKISNSILNCFMIISTIIIILGGAFLIFTYFIDGIYYQPPLISYDIIVSTDKKIYKVGESVYVTGNYCFGRDRDNAVIKGWTFVDGLIYSVPNFTSYIAYKKGCQTITAYVTDIPKALPLGIYHLEGTLTYEVNKARTMVYPRKTNTFEIIK